MKRTSPMGVVAAYALIVLAVRLTEYAVWMAMLAE